MRRKPELVNEARVRAMMARAGTDLLILRTNANSKYLSEFFHNGGNLGYRPFVVFFFLDPARAPALIVPAVDLHLAMDSTWIDDVRAYQMAELFTDLDVPFHEDFFAAATQVLADRNVQGMVIGTEGEDLSTGFREKLENGLLAGHKIVDVSYEMELVRMVKGAEEIRRLRRATEITVAAHESFRRAIRPGNTDRDLHRAATTRMYQEGADDIRFINIGTGALSYAAHSPFPTGHVLAEGDFVKVDMGAECMGYPADFVRSYYLGRATDRARDIWGWLNDAQLETGAWLRPGVTGGEIFAHSHALISRNLNNYPREFFGHGLGIGSHEQPRMNRPNQVVLEANTVVCLESSYYHEGVRFHTEDTYLVTDDGIEHWTVNCPRDLVVHI